jgi:hypothetical protein
VSESKEGYLDLDTHQIEQDALLIDPANRARLESLQILDPLADLEALTTSYIELITPGGHQVNQGYAPEEAAFCPAEQQGFGTAETMNMANGSIACYPAEASWNPDAVASCWDEAGYSAEGAQTQGKPDLPESKPVGHVVKQLPSQLLNSFIMVAGDQTFAPLKEKYILGVGPGCGPKPKPKTEINSEFNSIHFGIEISRLLKFLTPISFWV